MAFLQWWSIDLGQRARQLISAAPPSHGRRGHHSGAPLRESSIKAASARKIAAPIPKRRRSRLEFFICHTVPV
jgi:hypothetical protein